MAKHTSQVRVQYAGQKGKPVGKKVTLHFASGGSKEGNTDRLGVATIGHDSDGTAWASCDGKRSGTFRAPGETVIFL